MFEAEAKYIGVCLQFGASAMIDVSKERLEIVDGLVHPFHLCKEVERMERKVLTICGSIRFMEKILEVHEKLELQGHVVIGVVQHVRKEPYTPDEEDLLDVIHKIKIDIADGIYVVNVDGYIGASTRSEIEYAQKHGKEVYYLIPPENRSAHNI